MSIITDIEAVFGGGQNDVGQLGQWFSALRPASFRGVPFAVLGSNARFGRRVSVHEYPFRDSPWVEDLGRSTRRINLHGFLVTDSAIYGGGDVISQRERLIAAVEQSGPGTLIHPTLGELQVSIAENGFSVIEKWDSARYFEIQFSFVESGKRLFPTSIQSTAEDVNSFADLADLSASEDFVARAHEALSNGAAVVQTAVNSAAMFARSAQQLANDATNINHLVGTLKGTYGRYFGGRNKGGIDGITNATSSVSQTINSLIAQGASARSAVNGAAVSLNSITSEMSL